MGRIIMVIKTPPGFAREEIRKQWVGIEMPCLSLEEEKYLRETHPFPDDGPNSGGFLVVSADAVRALDVAGRYKAALFWSKRHPIITYLEFRRDCCKEI